MIESPRSAGGWAGINRCLSPTTPFLKVPYRPRHVLIRDNGVILTPEAFQPVTRGCEALPRVMRLNGALRRRGVRTLCNPSGVDIDFPSIPGVRFATPGYRLPTLRVEDAGGDEVGVTNRRSGGIKVEFL